MSNNCKSRDSFNGKYKNLYSCCFNFYRTGLIAVTHFCTSCKVFFASLPDFQLKKPIFIDKAIEFCQYIQFFI